MKMGKLLYMKMGKLNHDNGSWGDLCFYGINEKYLHMNNNLSHNDSN